MPTSDDAPAGEIQLGDKDSRGGSERRRKPRAEIGMPLRLRIPNVDAALESEAVNVSQGGMFIAMDEPPPVGTEMDIEVELESGQLLLHATAKVMRQQLFGDVPGVGVEFIDVSYEATALIDRMVNDEKLFGQYKLEQLIGQGGMAEVYRAKVLEGKWAGERVALKRIRPDLAADPVFVDLLKQEAQVTSALNHPNIVRVLDVGQVGGTTYIAMEYIIGCDLARIIDTCGARGIFIPLDFACYVMETVSRALHHAHIATDADGLPYGIIHRDVGPSNVFISDKGEIKLGDFGVAHIAGVKEDDVIVGKDPYMAPEHIRGDELTPAADVFALGAVLYEMLTNQMAFTGDDTDEIWDRILAGDVARPTHLRSAISPELEECVLRAIAVDLSPPPVPWVKKVLGKPPPAARVRFHTAEELANALRGLYDPAIGTQMAIASVVRHLLGTK